MNQMTNLPPHMLSNAGGPSPLGNGRGSAPPPPEWNAPEQTPELVETLLRRPPPGVSDLQRDQNAGVRHRGVRDVQKVASAPQRLEKM